MDSHSLTQFKAIKYSARARGQRPYDSLVRLLSSGDLDTQINSLTLLISLLHKCDKRKCENFIEKWRKLSVEVILRVSLQFT